MWFALVQNGQRYLYIITQRASKIYMYMFVRAIFQALPSRSLLYQFEDH